MLRLVCGLVDWYVRVSTWETLFVRGRKLVWVGQFDWGTLPAHHPVDRVWIRDCLRSVAGKGENESWLGPTVSNLRWDDRTQIPELNRPTPPPDPGRGGQTRV